MKLRHRALLVVTCCAAGCGDPDSRPGIGIDLAVVRQSQIDVRYDLGAVPDELEVAVHIVLPAPGDSDQGACYRFARDLGVRIDGRGPKQRLVSDIGNRPPAPTCSSQQIAEVRFTLPQQDRPLSLAFVQGRDELTVTVTRPARPQVEATLLTTTATAAAPFWVDLRTTTGALSTGAACWDTWLCRSDAGRVDCERGALQVAAAQPTETGVRLELRGVDTDLALEGTLWLSSRAGAGCNPEPTITCPTVAACSTQAGYGYVLGPYALTPP